MKLKSLCLAVAVATSAILTTQAQAACFYAPPQANSTVTANDNGSYHYSILATGGSGSCSGQNQAITGYMSDFYLPYFDDMGISGLSVQQTSGPEGLNWNYAIQQSNNIFGLGGGALYFYAASAPDTLSYDTIQIDFDAAFGEVKGPFSEVITNLTTGNVHDFLGDPGIPGSPKTIAALDAANGQDPSSNVPEPATLSLFALGATALIARRRKKS